MQASIFKLGYIYKVKFARPAFSQVTTFAEIIGPIHDAFSHIVPNPSSEIEINAGNSISNSSVVLNLPLESGFSVFEARLDGYKVSTYRLPSLSSLDSQVRNSNLFETAVLNFLSDCEPVNWFLDTRFWLSLDVDDALIKSEQLIKDLTSYAQSEDPFGFGSTEMNASIQFNCINEDEKWAVRVYLDKSELPGSHLFLRTSGEYHKGSIFDTIEQKIDHLKVIHESVTRKLDLTLWDN